MKDAPLIQIKSSIRQSNGCYLHNNASQEKTRICCQEKTSFPLCTSRAVCSRLLKHSRLSTPDLLWGQPNARPRSPAPRAALAPTGVPGVQPGVSWRALESSGSATDTRERFITGFPVLSTTGRTMGHLLITAHYPSGSDRGATEESIFLPLRVCF